MGMGGSNTDGHTMPNAGYLVTGRAAHGRVARLFRSLLDEAADESGDTTRAWVDASPYAKEGDNCDLVDGAVAFLWENAPRSETKAMRDAVRCYSHLPNGIILDDKWALARLLGQGRRGDAAKANPNLATLESHCFRGADFGAFAERAGLLTPGGNVRGTSETHNGCEGAPSNEPKRWEDLLPTANGTGGAPPPMPSNLWVLKDAMSNGAGGIWILDETNVRDFLDDGGCTNDNREVAPPHLQPQQSSLSSSSSSSILHPDHRYIAQKYAWPPTLYSGRKCHVRVYALLTSDGRAYVHRRAFLHVANEPFGSGGGDGNGGFESSVHITNCCANSHDPGKFAGEICADLNRPGPMSACGRGGDDSTEEDLPLGDYYPSMAASVAELAQRFEPYTRGGEANGGFEYLGLDFVLSSVEGEGDRRKPVAYLLEVNAPPSQDTATGLAHAEELHDEVISDLLRMWVLPKIGIAPKSQDVGWMCVHAPKETEEDANANLIVPSKAAILNRIRWALFERRALSVCESVDQPSDAAVTCLPRKEAQKEATSPLDEDERHCESSDMAKSSFDADAFVAHARAQFPYFNATDTRNTIFFESGGGAQVPTLVSDAVAASMSNRDRSKSGAMQQREARAALSSLLIDDAQPNDDHLLVLGQNATSLLDQLARKIGDAGVISEGDEIIIASENHLANVTPWIRLANSFGAKVKWWTVTNASDQDSKCTDSCILSKLVTAKTKIVAISHASNVLGTERDVASACDLVRRATNGRGQVIVDGVAAAPHLLASGSIVRLVDWYVVSLHKLFGPHLGCLVGKRSFIARLCPDDCEAAPVPDERLCKSLEMGTMNYEACSGATALKAYFQTIAKKVLASLDDETDCTRFQSSNQITSESPHDHLGSGRRSAYEGGRLGSNATSYVQVARECIRQVELPLLNHLLGSLQSCNPLVRIIQDAGTMKVTAADNAEESFQRIPIVCFVHEEISSAEIVQHCRRHGLICRASKFLSTERLFEELGIPDQVVRFSLAHYNTRDEIDRCIGILEMLSGWRTEKCAEGTQSCRTGTLSLY